MNSPSSKRFLLGLTALAALIASPVALAQTPPTATTTFTGATDTAWTDGTNWDTGLPDAADDAWIGTGQTAVVTSAYLDANPFGTLTLGENATLQLSATGKTGLPVGSNVYLSNGSYLQLTGGDFNRSVNLNVLAGATASFKPAASNSDTIVSGSAVGAADSVLNIDITNATFFRARWSNAGFLGTINYTSTTNGRTVDLSNFAATNTAVGPGTTTFGDKVKVVLGGSNRMSDSATVKLIGGAGGGSNVKFDGVNDRSDTIANLIIDSPTASTGAYINMRNGFLKVSNGVSFEGTAGTIDVNNNLWPSQYEAGLDVRGADLVFGGTGDWSLVGDAQLRVDGSTTITTNTNATISNYLWGSGTIQKYGDGTLTLNGNAFNPNADGDGSVVFTGSFAVNAGELVVAGAISGINVTTGAELTIGSSASAADTLTLGAGGLTLANDAAINWQYDGAGIAGTDYDTIVSTATLDLTGISNLIINGLSLGYEAQIGDSFTLFSGTVLGFDPSKFTLNLPTLTTGEWAIQEGSLVLTVIPESSSFLLGALGLLACISRRRRA